MRERAGYAGLARCEGGTAQAEGAGCCQGGPISPSSPHLSGQQGLGLPQKSEPGQVFLEARFSDPLRTPTCHALLLNPAATHLAQSDPASSAGKPPEPVPPTPPPQPSCCRAPTRWVRLAPPRRLQSPPLAAGLVRWDLWHHSQAGSHYTQGCGSGCACRREPDLSRTRFTDFGVYEGKEPSLVV